MSSEPDARLLIGESIEHARVSIKAAAVDVLRLSVALSTDGCATHVAPLRAAHGYLKDALGCFKTGATNVGKEMAVRLAETLPQHEAT